MGPDQGPGWEGKGCRVINTQTGRVRVLRNLVMDERSEVMRELPLPGGKWRSSREKVEREEAPEGKGEGETKGEEERHAPPPKPEGSDDRAIEYMVENPKTKGYQSWGCYELYKHARTIKEFLELGGTHADLR